jgi:hypothetical protein
MRRVRTQSGFLGHQNDAQHFRLMPQIGYNQELDFPQNFVLLADKIYPNGYPQLFYSVLNHI